MTLKHWIWVILIIKLLFYISIKSGMWGDKLIKGLDMRVDDSLIINQMGIPATESAPYSEPSPPSSSKHAN